MIERIISLIRERNFFLHRNCGVSVCVVPSAEAGFALAGRFLEEIVDRRTVLYLSGGKKPRGFYRELAREEKIIPGAVGLVDERYGERWHIDSNEKMIRETGFLRYLEMLDIPFYPILQSGKSREETAELYDMKLRELQSIFRRHVGILGIGMDGHTAGIPAKFSNDIYNCRELVTEYNDEGGKYGERVTMTFLGLSMLDVLLVLVFGKEKRDVLELVFQEGSESEVPGRFLKRKEIAEKTVLITDQQI